MTLLGSTEQVVVKDKNDKNVPKFETVDLILVHCNVGKNNYQQAIKLLLKFVPEKQFGQLITVLTHSLIMLKTTNTEFSFIEVYKPFIGLQTVTIDPFK